MDLIGALLLMIALVSLVGLVSGAVQTVHAPPTAMSVRLAHLQRRAADSPDGERRGARPAEEGPQESALLRWLRHRQDLVPTITLLVRRSRLNFLKTVERDLIRLRAPLRVSELILVAAALGLLTFLVLYLVMRSPAFAAVVGATSTVAPFLIVRTLARQWLSQFEQLLSETLLLMANSIQSGYGIMQAMTIVANEGTPPLSDEFQRALHAIHLGATVDEAMQGMCERIQSPDLDLAMTAILITRQLGGSLSEVLTTISNTIRQRITLRRELTALTAEGRLSGIGMALLPIGLMIILNIITGAGGREPYTRILFTDPLGQKLLIYWAGSLLVGYLAMKRIVDSTV